MRDPALNTAEGVSLWVIIPGSVLIGFHLFAVGVRAISAESGPWPVPMGGMTMMDKPQFAKSMNEFTGESYLKLLKMTDNYHFTSNNQRMYAVYFEAILHSDSGKEPVKVRYPEPGANSVVRYRQGLLARYLTADEPVTLPQSQPVNPESVKYPDVQFWDGDPNHSKLRTESLLKVPRDRPMVVGPSNVEMMMVKAIGRYLGRAHEAGSFELIRHTQMGVPPDVLFQDNIQSMFFDPSKSEYGKQEIAK